MNIIKEESEAAKKDEAIKAEVSKPNKDVVELETKGFDYKDKKMFISYQKPKLKKLDAF